MKIPSTTFPVRSLSLACLLGMFSPLAGAAESKPADWEMVDRDPIKTELVMQLVVTCTDPEPIGAPEDSKDGKRRNVWPIIGGEFQGKNIRGTVVPGGGDFPVLRPDGVVVVDALYRLRTDDGVTIIIHNKGISYGAKYKYRLLPEFIAPQGKYEWLNNSVFLATLSEVPEGMKLAKGAKENDRLIQVYRVL